MLLQQALALGVMGYGIAMLMGHQLFPYFPRRVVVTNEDLFQLFCIVLAISVLSSLLGICRSMRVNHRSVDGIAGNERLLAIEIRQLNKVYGSGRTEVVALRQATLQVPKGQVVALLGPSGSGKSTLLTIIGLVITPTSGQVLINGQLVIDGSHAKRTCDPFVAATLDSSFRGRT